MQLSHTIQTTGLVFLGALALSACDIGNSGPQTAQVIGVTPIQQTTNTPQQECHNEAVTTQKPVKDEHQLLGSAIGAVAGGVIGHQFGGGKGKKAATAGGAIAGAVAGNRVQARHQQNSTETTTREVCNTVNRAATTTVGYNVKYELDGKTHSVRMDHKPGDTLTIENGKVVGAQ